jgi:hypothetical protein
MDSWKPTCYGTCFRGYKWSTNRVSVYTSDQQTFPWILICYIRGCSDQNEVSRSSDQNRERPEWSQSQPSEYGASPRQSFIVSCCNWLWLREIAKEGVNKSSHPIQTPLLLVIPINTWQYQTSIYDKCTISIHPPKRRTCINYPLPF